MRCHLMDGRILGMDINEYRKRYPGHLIIFDAQVITKTNPDIWEGDLDIHDDFIELQNLREEIGEDLYVTKKSMARKKSIDERIDKSICIIKKDKINILRTDYKDIYGISIKNVINS